MAKSPLAKQTASLIGRYLEQVTGAQVEEVNFQSFWIVSQFAGTPSPVHFHSGDISGVLYLKVPEISEPQAEDAKTYISGRQAGYINFLLGGRQQYSKSIISFKPQIGDFYIFPGWILHGGAVPWQGRTEIHGLQCLCALFRPLNHETSLAARSRVPGSGNRGAFMRSSSPRSPAGKSRTPAPSTGAFPIRITAW